MTPVSGGETKSVSTLKVGHLEKLILRIFMKFIQGDERDDFGQLTEFFCGQEDECT